MGAPYRPSDGKTRLTLNSIENSRKTIGRLLRKYYYGQLDESTFRTLIYGLSHYLSYLKLEMETDLERRIEAIEDVLKNG